MLELIEKIARDGEVHDTVTLPYDLRQKTRQRLHLDSGGEAALLLPPGTPLDHGDCLRGADGTLVRVIAATEAVTTARTDDPLRLARACYHLGNRHVPLQVGPGWARYQPDHVLDEMVRGLGLAVLHETARFEPERGAYHPASPPASPEASPGNPAGPEAAHGHAHHHDHGHGPHGHRH